MAVLTPEKWMALAIVAVIYFSIIIRMIRQAIKISREPTEFQTAPEEAHDNRESRA